MNAADTELGEQLARLFSGSESDLAEGIALLDRRLRASYLKKIRTHLPYLQHADAEDLWQKCLFTLWQHAPSLIFDGNRNWRGLVWKILVNASMDLQRQKYSLKRGGAAPAKHLAAEPVDPTGSPEEQAIRHETEAQQWTAFGKLLDQLPEPERNIVSMLLKGLKDREIGDALKMNPSTVASHIFRAMNNLRKKARASGEEAL
jgi:RNA polymerase sigma factor (sigma-70 family)